LLKDGTVESSRPPVRASSPRPRALALGEFPAALVVAPGAYELTVEVRDRLGKNTGHTRWIDFEVTDLDIAATQER
jgi:hypothetical protein